MSATKQLISPIDFHNIFFPYGSQWSPSTVVIHSLINIFCVQQDTAIHYITLEMKCNLYRTWEKGKRERTVKGGWRIGVFSKHDCICHSWILCTSLDFFFFPTTILLLHSFQARAWHFFKWSNWQFVFHKGLTDKHLCINVITKATWRGENINFHNYSIGPSRKDKPMWKITKLVTEQMGFHLFFFFLSFWIINDYVHIAWENHFGRARQLSGFNLKSITKICVSVNCGRAFF